ncbi:hypothetical protein [Paraburkholderia sediminicola]|uniref:hypothetical protein n=1 Tax=Paraburkholderia sediminicola TaxID=458836 RepID=UPI0038BD317C
MPAIINVAILAGLALALLVDAGTARALAWLLLCLPLGAIAYGCLRGKRGEAQRGD